MNPYYEALEFNIIIEKLKEQALSEGARRTLEKLAPCPEEDGCRRKMAETTSARAVLDSCGTPPFSSMQGLEELLQLGDKGGMLIPGQLTGIARFASDCKRLAAYLERGEAYGPEIAVYGRNLSDLTQLQRTIEESVGQDRVFDEASPGLRGLRRKMENIQDQIKEKLSHILKSRKQYLADSYIAIRNGHYVVPVRREFQKQFGGAVIEVSGKGGTVFMEPSSVTRLQAELTELSIEEDGEVRKILYMLTVQVMEAADAVRGNMEVMKLLDVLFAKAKLSAVFGARGVEIGGERRIKIIQGRHPLLEADRCVPLDFEMEETTSGVIVTGPNTGGKTVAMKTVGLLSLMAQCGLHIPCGEGSYIAMQDGFWCDIGDSQNISQNLSTFSGHITNVIKILEQASRDSLVLLDELGSGTDPAEGMGIAVAVLEELRCRGCMFLVTTHYPQVKDYAQRAERIKSARMAFDRESLKPLYRLEMGKAGDSCALYIAKRLGLAPHLLERARREAYGGPEPLQSDGAVMDTPPSRLVRSKPVKTAQDLQGKFSTGDSVMVLPEKEIGIVFRPADQNGNVIVQVKGVKKAVRHSRLRLQVAASELYPKDYDFSIIFDTVENRKAKKVMSKRYDPEAAAVYDSEEY